MFTNKMIRDYLNYCIMKWIPKHSYQCTYFSSLIAFVTEILPGDMSLLICHINTT